MEDKPRAVKAIAVMLNCFPAQGGSDPDMQLRGYLMAVDDLSAGAIEEAAKRFVSGKASDHDGRFAPSSAQFAKEARFRQEINDLKAAAEKRPKLPPPEPDNSPRIGPEKMADLSRALETGDWSHLSKYARTEH